jgi:GAF domain-containing protein
MTQHHHAAVEIQSPDRTNSTLHGPRILLARLTWLVLVALSLGLFVSGILVQFSPQFKFGALAPGDPRFLGPQEILDLARFGLTLHTYQLLYNIMDLAFLLAYSAVAFLLVRRKSSDGMAIAVSAALVMYGASLTYSFQTLLQFAAVPSLFPKSLNALSTVSVPILAYLFPDGRFVPRWTRWLAGLWGLWALASLFLPLVDPASWPSGFEYLLFLVGLATAIYAQLYRYQRVSTPEQRQQTKWSVFGLGVAILGYAILPILSLVYPALLQPGPTRILYGLCFTLAVYLSQLAVPVSIGISILRYRLWDIDLVINRSLVYLIVTGIVVLLFEESSHLLQAFFQNVVRSDSPLSEFLPAVVVGLSLHPLSERTQEVVNRRFYRDKVDAQEAFEHFEREVRRIINLSDLLHLLLTRVSDLLHLSYCAVYLRNPDGQFQLAEANQLPPGEKVELPQDGSTLKQLESGCAISRPHEKIFPLLVPLTLPPVASSLQSDAPSLVAILALGPRYSGQGFSSEDQALLLEFADQVGTAIYVARLVSARPPT